MKNPFSIGQTLTIRHLVQPADTAAFETGQVHPVYATFALARDLEWAGRQFVLEMLDEDEERGPVFDGRSLCGLDRRQKRVLETVGRV
jgi:hypothetical protein